METTGIGSGDRGLNRSFFEYFDQHAVSVAILCDANPNWRPKQYSFNLPQTALNFEFGMMKLMDYRDRWMELEASQNPFAWVVMAQLKMQETKQDKPAQKIWKIRLVRRLYESGYNQDDVVNLFHLIDWLLKLPKGLEAAFWQELQAYEEERRMPYITSVERIGMEKGRKEGRKEEARSMIFRQLNHKFGELSDRTTSQIDNLSIQAIRSLSKALLDFGTIADLETWLTEQADR